MYVKIFGLSYYKGRLVSSASIRKVIAIVASLVILSHVKRKESVKVPFHSELVTPILMSVFFPYEKLDF